jgi:hypothetical protein
MLMYMTRLRFGEPFALYQDLEAVLSAAGTVKASRI